MLATLLILAGCAAAALHLALILWSIWRPARALWPLDGLTPANQLLTWGPTVTLFAAAALLGVLDWGTSPLPAFLRWGVGLPLVIAGNLVVWRAVFRFGYRATSGGEGALVTDGVYAWSRNPQYMADCAILTGWALLAAAPSAALLAALGCGVLLLAPLAEEPWLARRHGAAWEAYRSRVRRYI